VEAGRSRREKEKRKGMEGRREGNYNLH